MENTVTMSLDRYDQIKTDYQIACEELRCARQLNSKMHELKIALLESNLEEYRIKSYRLAELTNINGWEFAIKNAKMLLQVGITIDEMIEFIKAKKEAYEAEQERENEDE